MIAWLLLSTEKSGGWPRRWLVLAARAGPEPGVLEQVFIHIDHPGRPQVLVAQQARVEPARGTHRYLVLSQGYRYDGVPGRADYRVLRYREYALRLQAGAVQKPSKWDALPSRQLWDAAGPAAAAELHTRLSRPLTVVVLALLAVPLARFRPGASRYYPLWLGILVFALYFNLLNVGQLWIGQGRMPAWLAVPLVTAAIAATAISASTKGTLSRNSRLPMIRPRGMASSVPRM